MMNVPASFKRPGTIPKPFFLWDNTAFVLGVSAAEGKNAETRRVAFRDFHLAILAETDDPGLKALRLFLESWTPDKFTEPLWPEDMKDQNVVFALESERRQNCYLHDRPAAKELWAQIASSNEGRPQVCLVSGLRGPVARLHPAIKGVWGAQSSGASIVSFNRDSFNSYGHSQGDNSPVSELSAFKYTAALNALLASSNHRLQIGDTSTVFWAVAPDDDTAKEAESLVLAMFSEVDEESEAQKVGTILKRMRRGVPLREVAPRLATGVRFYVLGLAPNAARLSIRFWFEDDFGRLAENYQRFVADMAIDPPPRDMHPTLRRYLSETAVLGKRENVPPNLAGEWMRAILGGTPYPLTLLSTVLMRIRSDKQVNALRAGLLKAVLIRNFKNKEAPVSFDPDNRNKGYLLGRLFAVYEQTQAAALGRNVNATIKDKFYGAASAQPRKVFPLLDRGSVNHLSKIGKQKPGLRVTLEKTISGILEAMDPNNDPFPASLNAEEQALFSLGYYHQRNEFFRKPEIVETEEAA